MLCRSFRDPLTDQPSPDSAKAFETGIMRWKDNLTECFLIDFREDIDPPGPCDGSSQTGETYLTEFPKSPIVDVQACDLQIMANSLILKLRMLFLTTSESGGVHGPCR